MCLQGCSAYVFQQAHPSAQHTTPWYSCSHRLHVTHRCHLALCALESNLFSSAYATALYMDDAATLADLHESVTTLEDTARIIRRVLGKFHPRIAKIEEFLQESRATLRAREAPGSA